MIKQCTKCQRNHEATYEGECRNLTCGADLSKPHNFVMIEEVNHDEEKSKKIDTITEEEPLKEVPLPLLYKRCKSCNRFYPFSTTECHCQVEAVRLVAPVEGLTLNHLETGQKIIIKPEGSTTLGREGDYAYFFQSSEISRQHLKIIFADGYPYVVDEKSLNGTFINNVRLRHGERYLLRYDDILKVGITVGYTFTVS